MKHNSEIKDCIRIQQALQDNQTDATIEECAELWSDYSATYCASWLNIPEEKEDIWVCLEDRVLKRRDY